MTNKRTRFSVKDIYNHLLNLFADATFIVVTEGQREQNFSPVPLEQSNMTVWNSGHSLTLAEHLQASQVSIEVRGDASTLPLCPSQHGHLHQKRKDFCPWLVI